MSEEVLDQSEIDALLAAVEQPTDMQETGDGTRVFSRKLGLVTNREIDVRDYDFKRPERVSKDQMRALETLHENFARNYGAGLSGLLRTIVEVKVCDIEQMTFSEFTHSLPNPTSFNLLSCNPLEGNICIEISPLIVYPIIDRLLGGSNAELFVPQRPVTSIEQRLVNKLLDRATVSLYEAWEHLEKIQFKLEESESNPALVQIVAPNEVVVVVRFEVHMSGRAGGMSLCVPYNVIEPLVEKLSSQAWSQYKRHVRDPQLRQQVGGRLAASSLPVSATLADTKMTLNELANLEVGDIILTEKPAQAPLVLKIAGRRKFVGYIGQYRGNRAFRVNRECTVHDRV